MCSYWASRRHERSTPRHASPIRDSEIGGLAQCGGFTVTELLVVISLVALTLGIVLPGVSAMRNMNQTKAAINALGAAVTAARANATVKKVDLEDINPIYAGFTHSGVAILFTPAGEMRLVENQQDAVDDDTPEPLFLEALGRNGYRDIPRSDYVKVPRNAGVVGIARNAQGASGLLLLTPPFAVRFTEHGTLIVPESASDDPDRMVYYDGDYDGYHARSDGRFNGYDADDWDPHSPTYTDRWDNTVKKYELPFEELETVVGVMVYSKPDLRQAGLGHSGTASGINTAARDWILANGQAIFFGRHTGTLITR